MKKPPKLNRENVQDILALTPMQEGMLFLYLKDPHGDFYLEQLSLSLTGDIDRETFKNAWEHVIAANGMLRTQFKWEKVKNPVQIILREFTLIPGYVDLSGHSREETERKLEQVKRDDRNKRFDLRKVPFRVSLCKVDKEGYEIIISYHHIIFDGWSSGIILKEFFAAYDDLAKGKEIVKPIKAGFKEYISEIQNKDRKKQEEFWREYLSDFDKITEISIKKLIREPDRETDDLRIGLPAQIGEQLKSYTEEYKITMAALLYAAYGILLHKYNNSDDVIFGTTVSGRSASGVKGIEEVVGLCMNTLPLRVGRRPGETVKELLRRVNDSLQKRDEFEHTPLVDIAKYCRKEHKEELFDSIIVIENYPLNRGVMHENRKLSLSSYSMLEKTHYDLTLQITLFDDIELRYMYNPRSFDREDIERFSRHYLVLLENIVDKKDRELDEIEILSREEKRQIMVDFNSTAGDYPRDKTIHRLFEEQVEKTPDRIAVLGPVSGSNGLEKGRSGSPVHHMALTYRVLCNEADRLAGKLIDKGLKQGDIAAVLVNRSIGMITGIFAILKARGAYLPIDPGYPQERIDYILADSSAKIVLTAGFASGGPLFEKSGAKTFDEGQERRGSARFCVPPLMCSGSGVGARRAVPVGGESDLASLPAYVIYTSGTTGNPKGVVIEHRAVVNILTALHREYPLREQDAYLLKTAYVFDVSVTELFGWFMEGGRLAIPDQGAEKDPKKILDIIEKNGITHLNFVPSMFNVFAEELNPGNIGKLGTLKYIFLAGEALLPGPVNTFRQFGTPIQLENIYGPTEGTVYSSSYSLSRWQKGESIPIGKPMQNINLYILDKDAHLQPIGVPGELSIAGENLARGYLNRPELTSEKFPTAWGSVEDPSGHLGAAHHLNNLPKQKFCSNFSKSLAPGRVAEGKIYKTGDMARWLPDGIIEFLGRIDQQVKIRGFRVELGEIENRLLKYDSIKEAVVAAEENESGEKYLIAYIVKARRAEPLDTAELRSFLSGVLPGYMIPAHYVELVEIPLTTTGKVDRKALRSLGTRINSGVEYAPPVRDLEKKIARIWKQLLNIDKVGINDNFFDSGGNSLTIIRLSSRLGSQLNRDIPVVTLFDYPTIAKLAAHLGSEGRKTGPVDSKETGDTVKKDFSNREIAVIGMAGRFPGAKNIGEFWRNLAAGEASITFHTREALMNLNVESQLIDNPDFVPAKGILNDKEFFDASFFDYSPPEAEIMDPQLRIFHECCWQAIEDAGYNIETCAAKIGLYAGATPNPYWEVLPLQSDKSYSEQWNAIQFSDKDFLATRVGYKLNFKGPCVTIQTACSTSLVAVDQACQAILTGRCDMALAGGVSITMQDESGYLYQEGTIMSPDGLCRAFDAGAKGTVGGNGVGVVVLKPLKEAAADGDHIYAVVKGSAINNDGKNKVGFTAPSVAGQARAIRAAQQLAGIEPESISYIETHGTGTPLGDPVEIAGLKKVFAQKGGIRKNYCALGSVKTNIGHLDAAAGIAGFIKTVLTLKNKWLPPSLHFKSPNPELDLENSPFYVNDVSKKWENEGFPLRAGVSSFGLGGTNAHVILEEYDDVGARRAVPGEIPSLILLSAKDRPALDRLTLNLSDFFKENPGIGLRDTAYTLQVGRQEFAHRRVLVCRDQAEAEAALSSPGSEKVRDSVVKNNDPPLIFMYSGQGAQYVNMGLDLYRNEPLFRQEMDRCFHILKLQEGYDVKGMLYPFLEEQQEESTRLEGVTGKEHDDRDALLRNCSERLDDCLYSGPVKFIFEYSLTRLSMAWGIQPQAMIGHSFGEYVVACLSGVFSLEDALKLAVFRGQVMEKSRPGAMLSVSLNEEEVVSLLEKYNELSLAAVNSPSLCIISGPSADVTAFEQELNEAGHDSIRINFPRASHSHMMSAAAEEFIEKAAEVTFNEPKIPYISGLTGTWIRNSEATSPGYWSRHLCETIRFSDGLQQLLKEPDALFMEMGPGRSLTLFLSQHPDLSAGHRSLNLVRHKNEEVPDSYYTLDRIGELWSLGIKVDWQGFYAGEIRRRLPLPSYPFERQRWRVDALQDITLPEKKKRTGIDDWFYIPSWKRAAGPLKKLEVNCCLVFEDECGIASRLREDFEAEGHEVISVGTGPVFKKTGETRFEMNPADDSGCAALFKDLQAGGKHIDKVIHCWGITPGILTKPGEENIERALDIGFFSLIALLNALGENGDNKVDVYMVTNFVLEVTGDESLCALKSTLLGAVKVAAKEYPLVNCRCIDIPKPGQVDRERDNIIEQLHREFERDTVEPVVALRGKYRWLPCYEPKRLEKTGSESMRLRKGGVYLITGGTGGIGLTLSAFLAKNYQAKLILTARSEFPEKEAWKSKENNTKIRKLLDLERLGGEVFIKSADVSDAEQMREVISEAEKKFGRINGVIHAAGVPGGGIIELRTREDMENVLTPKVKGTLVLFEIFKDQGLDFLIFCSSLSAITAPFAQVDYCAANIFLDTFARQHYSQGRTDIISINWNTWKEVGMAVSAIEELEKKYGHMQDHSLFENDISPTEAVDVFKRILRENQPQVIVSSKELDSFIKQSGTAAESLQNELLTESGYAAKSAGKKRPGLGTGYVVPGNKIEETLSTVWQDFFGIEEIGINDSFFELGGDSLKAVIVISKIHKVLDVKIPLKDFFNNPTIVGLAGYLTASRKNTFSAINPVEKREFYPLSSAQKRMYALILLEKELTSYNVPFVLALEGKINRKRLEKVFKNVILRHESLKTSFDIIDGEQVQRIHNPEDIEFEIEYKSAECKAQSSEQKVPWENPNHTCNSQSVTSIIERFIRPFDLSKAPLLRVGLIKTGEEAAPHILMVDMPHIIVDGTSVGIIAGEFISLYSDEALPEIRLQYKDFVLWKTRVKEDEKIKEQETYWLEELAGSLPLLDLPTDFLRPKVRNFAGKKAIFKLESEEIFALKELAKKEKTTLFTVLLAIYSIFLAKITGQEDILIGTPAAGRRHADLHNVIGMFVNTLVLRTYPGGEKSCREFLNRLTNRSIAAFENQDCQFEDLVEKMGIHGDPGRNPIFDVMFAFQSLDIPEVEIPGLSFKPYRYDSGVSKFDLSVICEEIEDDFLFTFEYSSSLFKEETIGRFIDYFKNVLSVVLIAPARRISGIEIITEEEKRKMLLDFNDTVSEYPRDKTIDRLFTEQVERTPHNTAINGKMVSTPPTSEAEDRGTLYPITLSYDELDRRSERLARRLREKIGQAEPIVGILTSRSIETIIGILGILKAGGAYLPIDPGYPFERKEYMLKDSAAVLLLFTPGLAQDVDTLRYNKIDTILIEEKAGRKEQEHRPVGARRAMPGRAAYVIYTSGSTGNPKGVLVDHSSVVNLIFSRKREFSIDQADRVLQFSSLCFDASVEQVFLALFSGACLILIDKNTLLDKESFADYIIRQSITHLNAVPSFLSSIGIDRRYKFKRVVSGGDICPLDLAKHWSKRCDFYNQYGPTETTVTAAAVKFIDCGKNLSQIPIGSPISNTGIYILDKQKKLVPLGAAGELYIGGDGVARGYLNRPELTAEKFSCRSSEIDRSYRTGTSSIPEKLYRTGDLARWLPDAPPAGGPSKAPAGGGTKATSGGIIEYLGRIDHQVKIRGLRIELGEIENRLMSHAGVKEAVVVDREGLDKEKYLCAYIAAQSSGQAEALPGVHPEAAALRNYLSDSIPVYMIPSYFVFMDSIPLTVNGKVDRKALPLPQTVDSEAEYEAPRDQLDEKMVSIWAGVLNREPQNIGIDDHFFMLGGHSLKAAMLIARVHQVLKKELKVMDIFDFPTIRELSDHIKSRGKQESGGTHYADIQVVEKKCMYPLSSAQKRLYILHQIDPDSLAYNISSFFQLDGMIDREKLTDCFIRLIGRHESLRTSFAMIEGEPAQRIHKPGDNEFEIEYFKAGNRQEAIPAEFPSPGGVPKGRGGSGDQERREVTCVPPDMPLEAFIRPFDLTGAPLLRVVIIQPDVGNHFLLVDMHHIIADGVSAAILIEDFMALYRGEELAPLKIRYKDYASWRLHPEKDNALVRQEEYWLEQFAGEIPVLDLPIDYVRPAVRNSQGRVKDFQVNEEETAALKHIAHRREVTLYMLLLAISNVFFAKISGREDVVVGTPTAGRDHVDLEQVAGMFVNTLGLRNYPLGEKPFEVLLEEVKKGTLTAFENQDYQFEDLVEKLDVKRDTTRSPLFDVMFSFQNMETPEFKIPGLELTPYDVKNRPAQFDMTLQVSEQGMSLSFNLEYSINLFKEETIDRFIRYYKQVITGVIENSQRKICEIDILTEEEKQRLLFEYNRAETESPADKTLDQLFAEQVYRTPDYTALVGPAGDLIADSISLTYRELNDRVDLLANKIKQGGVKPNVIVAVMTERNIEMVSGILSILKAGGAYLPLDPAYPEERTRFMIMDSNAPMLLTTHTLANEVEQYEHLGVNIVLIEETGNRQGAIGSQETQIIRPVGDEISYMHPGNRVAAGLAYIIFTSGTTGQPKGVLVEHRNAVNVVTCYAGKYNIGPGFKVLQMSDYTFDASVDQFFGTLLHGGELHIIAKRTLLDVEALRRYITIRKVGLIDFVPPMLKELLCEGERLKSLKVVIAGGERLGEDTKDKIIKKGYHLFNHYGPTETTVEALISRCSESRVNLGLPITNTQCYIVDKYFNVQPIGIAGELVISGAGVTRGYLNRPELTAGKFIDIASLTSNFQPAKSQRFYHTGDLARSLPGGNIEFLGRIDNQVKVRGFRIELGEIEERLLQHEMVKEAVVIIGEEENNENHIYAYITAGRHRVDSQSHERFNNGNAETLTSLELREFLSQTLPDHMIPSHFVCIDEIPLSPAGKVDRRALIARGEKISTGVEYVSPLKEKEKIIAQIWQEILDLDTVGIHDNFFDLGGNSLRLVTVNDKLKKAFGIDVPVAKMFRYPTISSLLKYIDQDEESTISNEKIEESVDQMEEAMQMLLGEEDE